MQVNTKQGPTYDPGICRCCGFMNKCRILSEEYEHNGRKEVYSDMFMDCFGLLLSNMDGEVTDRLVCAKCVWKLREANEFRKQVLKCEEVFLQRLHEDQKDFKVEIKIENDLSQNDDTEIYDGSNPSSSRPTSPLDNENCSDATDESDLKPLKRKQNKSPKKQSKDKSQSPTKGTDARDKLRHKLLYETQKLKALLKETQMRKRYTPYKPPNSGNAPRQLHEEKMRYFNLLALIECSYIFPFKNRISNLYCYYCKQIFTDTNELRNHTWGHNPKLFQRTMEPKRSVKVDITRIDCRLCPESITDIDTFKNHLTTVHKKKIYPVNKECIMFKLSMDEYKCLECSERFPFIDKLIDHMTEHYGTYICDKCAATFIDEISLKSHYLNHSKVVQNFPCDICGKNLKSNWSLQLHISSIHEKKAMVHCFKCEATFITYAQRTRHLINVHGDKRSYPCTKCEKVFDVRKTLMEHMRKAHMPAKDMCEICDRRFDSAPSLKDHKSVHTGERNYHCEYCDKCYHRRKSLIEHIRTHTNEGRYKCDQCNSTFSQNVSLKNHMKTHSDGFEMTNSFFNV